MVHFHQHILNRTPRSYTIIQSLPSIDCTTCRESTTQLANCLIQHPENQDTTFITITMDLPFALQRAMKECGDTSALRWGERTFLLSDYLHSEFGLWGNFRLNSTFHAMPKVTITECCAKRIACLLGVSTFSTRRARCFIMNTRPISANRSPLRPFVST